MMQAYGEVAASTTIPNTLHVMAVGRVVLGVGALAAPRALGARMGVTVTPELTYMSRIYGSRALAMAAHHLLSSDANRRRWQRLSWVVDTTDTVSAIPHLFRRDVPPRVLVAFAVITGGYSVLGSVPMLADLRSGISAARERGRP